MILLNVSQNNSIHVETNLFTEREWVMSNAKWLSLIAIIVIALSACTYVQGVEDNLVSEVGNNRPYPALRDFNDVRTFAGLPLNSYPARTMWILIDSAPDFHALHRPTGATGAPIREARKGCWTIIIYAIIPGQNGVYWNNTSTPQTQSWGPISFCYPDDMYYSVPFDEAAAWSKVPNTNLSGIPKRESNMFAVNVGVPPEHRVLNQDSVALDWFGGDPFAKSTYDAWMIAALMYQMGFDPSNRNDYRLWVAKVPPMAEATH